MTVTELLSRISSRELTEWMSFFELEPWGTETELLGHAITSATIANVNRDTKKRPNPFTANDFIPEFDRYKATENQALKIRQINAMFGGKEISK